MVQEMTRLFGFILGIGLLLRLVFAFTNHPASMWKGGGDELWYLGNGLAIYQAEPEGTVYNGFRYAVNALPSAPLYLLITGFFQLFLSFDASIYALWIVQSIIGTLTAYCAYRIAWKISNDRRSGYVAGTALALSPVMLREPTSILTESFYIFFLIAAFWVYCEFAEKQKIGHFLLIGFLFGLATLTRATSLLFPIGLAALVCLANYKNWKQGIALAFVLILSYTLTAGTWTAFNWFKYQRFVLGSQQLTGAFWRGAVESDASPRENDEQLDGQSFEEQAIEVISSDPNAYIKRRFEELLNAYLQPHGTVDLGDESLKAMAEAWINSGFSWDGFLMLINGEGFWPKLLIYLFYYPALLASFWGMWLSRKQWQLSLALIGFIAYTTLLHLVVLALPRYIFPTYPFFWIFAAIAFVWLWDKAKGIRAGMPQAPKT